MTLDCYLIREISKPLLLVCGLLIVIFASYSWVQHLIKVAEMPMPPITMISIIILKVAIALEVLLPVSLYLSVILGLGRMHSDSEMMALSASGISPMRVLRVVLVFSFFLALLVGSFSLYLRPWAYEQSYWLQVNAQSGFKVSQLEAGHFYERKGGKLVFFANELDEKREVMQNVFVQSDEDDLIRIIFAKEAYDKIDQLNGKRVPVLLNGYEYKINREGGVPSMTQFQKATIFLKDITLEYKRKAASTSLLAQSDQLPDIAELQWRFSTPISTILLSLMAIPLSRVVPRQGKYSKVALAILIFSVYYNLHAMTKTWVGQGMIPPFPGIWWVNGLLAVIVLGTMAPTLMGLRFRRSKASVNPTAL